MTLPSSFVEGLKNALFGLGLIVSCIVSVQAAWAADLDEDRTDFRDLLSMVPDISETSPYEDLRTAQFPPIWIVNYRAAERAAGVPTPRDWAALKSMDEAGFSAWSSAVSRFQYDPFRLDQLSAQALMARSAPHLAPNLAAESHGPPAVLGIGWFDVAQALILGGGQLGVRYGSTQGEYVAPSLVALRLRPDRRRKSRLASTLPARGFASYSLHGVDVWHRLDDGDLREDLALERDVVGTRWVDPFGVTHGSAARIAMLGDGMFGSPYWEVTELMLASARGEIQSIAEARDFRAALEAVTNRSVSAGSVVQIAFINRHTFRPENIALMTLGPYTTEEQRQSFIDWKLDPQGGWGRLPAYRLVAMADRQEDDDELAVLALVYDDLAMASAAAQTVIDRVRRFVPHFSGIQWFEKRGVKASLLVYDASAHGRAVALVALRHTPRSNPVTGLRRGQLFQDLFRHMLAGAVDFLMVN